MSPVSADGFFTTSATWEAQLVVEVTHLIFVSVDLYAKVVWMLKDLKHDQFLSLNMTFVVLSMLWHVTV